MSASNYEIFDLCWIYECRNIFFDTFFVFYIFKHPCKELVKILTTKILKYIQDTFTKDAFLQSCDGE